MIPTEHSGNANNEHQTGQRVVLYGNENDLNYVSPQNRMEWYNNSNYQSRTDKPRLANEIYARLIENAIRDQVLATAASAAATPTTNDQIPLNKSALLNAAYSGCNLIYRNW